MLVILLIAVLGLAAAPPRPQARVAGTIITASTRIPAGVYRLPSADRQHPAIIVRGSNLTVDFTGVTLLGARRGADPDTFTGLAVLVDAGENVTIRNLTARGYKIGISPGLHITGSDRGYNWKQRLYSLAEHESLLDWMSYHHNDRDEWLDQGAGIYVADSDRVEIDRSTVVQGQNGLMIVRSNGGRIWNDDFSFNSGIGIGLYRASGSTIQHTRIDFGVRGYGHTFYNRGQDLAGILIYEQSSGNVVAFNSVTHGGDGLFLWAGQTTMDSGEGGANDNVFYDNNFSFAPTDGLEATFSRNVFYGNRAEECWHGLWGGYSFDSLIAANRFARNIEAIAIEHGQNDRITDNRFDADETAIHLWSSANQDLSWGYVKARDTRSRDYVISGNTFAGVGSALTIAGTENVRIAGNRFDNVKTLATLSGETRNIGVGEDVTVPLHAGAVGDVVLPKPIPDGMDAKLPDAERRGRDAIIVDEWGPYDWKSPKLWPEGRSDALSLKLRVLGPAGEWTASELRGATIAPRAGRVPGVVTVTPAAGPVVDFGVTLTYTGSAVGGPRGERAAAGVPYSFGYRRFFVPIDWRIRYFTFGESAAPDRDEAAFARVLAATPVKIERPTRLDCESGGSIADGVPRDRVALVAEGEVDLPAGQYVLRTISDDGIRVWMDDKRIIDHWTPHESARDSAPVAGGRHRFKVQHYETGGFAELRFDILRR